MKGDVEQACNAALVHSFYMGWGAVSCTKLIKKTHTVSVRMCNRKKTRKNFVVSEIFLNFVVANAQMAE